MYLVCVSDAQFYEILPPKQYTLTPGHRTQTCDKCTHEGVELNLHRKIAPFQARFPQCCMAQGEDRARGLDNGPVELEGGQI